MLQIALMTLSLPENQQWQSLATSQGMRTITLLGVHDAQALDGRRDGTQAQGNWTRGPPRLPRHARGILAKYAGIDRIGLVSLTERFRELASATWIDDADFHLTVSMQSQG